METRDISDSVFEFFNDFSRRHGADESKNKLQEYGQKSASKYSNAPTDDKKYRGNEDHAANISLEYNSSGVLSSKTELQHIPDSGKMYSSSDYEYEDDFEKTSVSSHAQMDTSQCEDDTCGWRWEPRRKISPERSSSLRVSKNAKSRDMSIYRQYQIPKAPGSRRQQLADSSPCDRPEKRVESEKHRIKSNFKNTRHVDPKPNNNSTGEFSTQKPVSYLGEWRELYSLEDNIGSSSTFNQLSEAVVRNDRFSDNPVSSSFSSKHNRYTNMSFRKKLSLPHVDKIKRVQLTRNRRDEDSNSYCPDNKSMSRQHRTHASMAGREIAKTGPTVSSRPARKPPVPIPLKSEALYYNGELTVNVCGDKRGNPDKNKFNVTITVVHKHLKSHSKPYRAHQAAQCRRRWRNDDLDWDIINHRAALPGFNTATDPEVNRRYLQQFGI